MTSGMLSCSGGRRGRSGWAFGSVQLISIRVEPWGRTPSSIRLCCSSTALPEKQQTDESSWLRELTGNLRKSISVFKRTLHRWVLCIQILKSSVVYSHVYLITAFFSPAVEPVLLLLGTLTPCAKQRNSIKPGTHSSMYLLDAPTTVCSGRNKLNSELEE